MALNIKYKQCNRDQHKTLISLNSFVFWKIWLFEHLGNVGNMLCIFVFVVCVLGFKLLFQVFLCNSVSFSVYMNIFKKIFWDFLFFFVFFDFWNFFVVLKWS